MKTIPLLLFGVLLFVNGTLHAGETKPETTDRWADYLKQDHLFDDWFGQGPSLKERGIEIKGSSLLNIAGNPTGGRSQGFAAANSMGMQMIVDFSKFSKLQGLQFVTSGIWRVGESLTNNHLGNIFSVQQVFGGSNLRLYQFYLQQMLFEDQLTLQVGRMGAFDNFFSSSAYWAYMNNGFDGNPVGIFLNVPAFGQMVYPTSSWGMFGKWTGPKNFWYIQAGAYLPDSSNGNNASNGMNWTFNTDLGTTVLVQGGVAPNGNVGDPGLPGTYSLGVFFSSGKQPTFSANPSQRKNVGVYLMLQQTLWADSSVENQERTRNLIGPGAYNGLSFFSAMVISPDSEINRFPFFMNNGLIWQGMIPDRPDDFASIGVTWGPVGQDFSNFQQASGAPAQSHETVFEANYRWQATPFFFIQPNLQYVFNPGATGRISDALVLGAQIGVTF